MHHTSTYLYYMRPTKFIYQFARTEGLTTASHKTSEANPNTIMKNSSGIKAIKQHWVRYVFK